jgi:RNA ligase
MITYEQCCQIRDYYNNFQFYERIEYLKGYKICIFTYRLIGHAEFENPIPGSDLKAYEMRGVTFVFNTDGSLYRRFLALPKFFNIGQTEKTLYDNIKNKKVISINDKMDGSFIHFIELPDKTIHAKTIGATESPQAIEANKLLLKDTYLLDKVREFIDLNIQPCFEYVSPMNRIVCKYTVSELVLIQLRCMNTGKILDFAESPVDISNIKKTIKVDKTLEEICNEALTLRDIEGWVISFDDLMVKQKTKWYFELHSLLTAEIYREDYIIAKIVDETIDDYLSQIPLSETEVRANIQNVSDIVINYIKATYDNTMVLVEKCKELGYKDFYQQYNKQIEMNYAMGYVRYEKDVITMIKEDIVKRTYFLSDAQYFLENKKLR